MSKPRPLLTLLIGIGLGAIVVFGAQWLAIHGLHASTPLPHKMATSPTQPSAAAQPATNAAVRTAIKATSTLPDWQDEPPTAEQILYAQPALMQKALARLQPQRPDKVDLYLVTFGGDGGEDVFRNEAEYASNLFAQRFDARGHTLVLENNPATISSTPLATWSNLEIALAGMHKMMDPRQDILMLYLTTHGSDDHTLLVDLGSLPLDAIDADDLASIVGEQAFRWKVVVVNACYSGGFIPPMQGAGTLILTAARSDRSSFGCGSESKITYFGDAWLARALNQDDNLIDAFKRARSTIAGWETLGRLTPSEPQINIGAGIADQLKAWRGGFTPGPPLPFKPAKASRRQKSD